MYSISRIRLIIQLGMLKLLQLYPRVRHSQKKFWFYSRIAQNFLQIAGSFGVASLKILEAFLKHHRSKQ